jgi:tetratricopeptide (TPR) repeat protein
MHQTLEQQANTHNNDYSTLEAIYHRLTGSELVRDPYGSVHHTSPNLTLRASVVIPAWNARGTLEQCLIAIEQSSFNRKYPEQLEVIVVDDGSNDGTWELLQRLRLRMRLKAVRQKHHSRAHTQNTGIALAEGDVIISCDADMILTPFSIEEMVKRHQVFEHVMSIGFRGDVSPTDPRISPAVLAKHLLSFLPPFTRDVRLSYGAGGWPESMCRDSDHLKRLGGGKQIIMADGARWNLPGIVYGALFSLRRNDFVAMDGYDERFYGWGCEDTLVGVRVQAMENYVLPVYSAAGLHIAHGDRSPRKWHEFAANRRVFSMILQTPFAVNGGRWLNAAKNRVQRSFERSPDAGAGGLRLEMSSCLYEVFAAELADPDRRGKYLYALGRYEEAAAAFAEVRGTGEEEAWALFDRGKALRAAGDSSQAAALLEEAAGRLPSSPWPLIELSLALAAQGRFGEARKQLESARTIDPTNSWLTFLLQRPLQRHLERAGLYMRQGDYRLAIRDYEAALILDPRNATAQMERARALIALGQGQTAKEAFASYVDKLPAGDERNSSIRLELARLHMTLGETGAAKAVLEQARRLRPRDQEVNARLTEISSLATKAYPLPLARKIVEQSQAIPGWFGEDETDLLIALVLKVVACCNVASPPTLVEIGSYCGRATIAMGLTARGLDRTDARIVAVHEPTHGRLSDGRVPREVLRAYLSLHELTDLVIFAPEEDTAPWKRTSHLLLVDGRHDYKSVRGDAERYAPQLAPGGLLLFHDYANYFPDVQRYVDELLKGSRFEFIAHVGSLIALRCPVERSSS